LTTQILPAAIDSLAAQVAFSHVSLRLFDMEKQELNQFKGEKHKCKQGSKLEVADQRWPEIESASIGM
jgi:hypothetical protein